MRLGLAGVLLAIHLAAGSAGFAAAQSPGVAPPANATSPAAPRASAGTPARAPLTLAQAMASAGETRPPAHPSLMALLADGAAPGARMDAHIANRVAALEASARDLALADARATRRRQVMAQFFAVLSADRGYAIASERMSLAYGAFLNASRQAERHAASAIEVAEMEARYRDRLRIRSERAMAQRLARIELSLALERPDAPPSELEEPELSPPRSPAPAFTEAWPLVAKGHPRLAALRAMRDASVLRLSAGRPLSAGCAAPDARDASARADAHARCRRIERTLEDAVQDAQLELHSTLLSIDHLQGPARDAAAHEYAYRERVLDRARELSVEGQASHLGEAMTSSLEAADRGRRVDYDLALAVARLDLLVGRLQ